MRYKHILNKYGVSRRDAAGVSFILIFYCVFVIFIVARSKKKKAELNNLFRYTIATTTGKVKNIRSSGPDLNYRFKVGNDTYGGSKRFSNDGNINYDGGKYYVKFQPHDPSNNEILLDFPVIIDSENIPDSGWKHLPTTTNIEK